MSPRLNVNPWLLVALGGAGLFAFTQRKTIMLFGGQVVTAGREALFEAALPAYAKPYAPVILRVAREDGIDPFLIYALGDRETRWGTSTALDTPGPGGRGDSGHGHGLMQIDDRSHAPWIATSAWWDPYTNVKKGSAVLKGKLSFLAGRSTVRGLTDGRTVTVSATQASRRGVAAGSYPDPRPLVAPLLYEAAIAAYNTGEGNVLISVAAGKPPDVTTAGSSRSGGRGDYSADVARRAYELASAFTKLSGAA
jgi:hypothetical protein